MSAARRGVGSSSVANNLLGIQRRHPRPNSHSIRTGFRILSESFSARASWFSWQGILSLRKAPPVELKVEQGAHVENTRCNAAPSLLHGRTADSCCGAGRRHPRPMASQPQKTTKMLLKCAQAPERRRRPPNRVFVGIKLALELCTSSTSFSKILSTLWASACPRPGGLRAQGTKRD